MTPWSAANHIALGGGQPVFIATITTTLRPLVDREIDDFATLPYVKYVALHRDLLAQAHPSRRAQAEQVARLARAQGELVAGDGALEIFRLRTFRLEAVAP